MTPMMLKDANAWHLFRLLLFVNRPFRYDQKIPLCTANDDGMGIVCENEYSAAHTTLALDSIFYAAIFGAHATS